MSLTSDAICHARTIRERLRNPPNAVPDEGIDLKRPPKTIPVVNIEAVQQPEPEIEIVETPAEPIAEPLPEPLELPASFRALPLDKQIDALSKLLDQMRRQLDESDAAAEPVFPPKMIAVRNIQEVACRHFNVTRMEICSQRRERRITWPRQIAMWLCRELTTRSLPDIGHRFGGRDHTTVMHAIRKVDAMWIKDAELAAKLDAMKAELLA